MDRLKELEAALQVEQGRVEGLRVLIAELTTQRDDAERRAGSILQQCEQQQDRIVELEAALLAAAPPVCEFCDSPEHLLAVCSPCWNKANEGSGWMQRALKAEAAETPPAELVAAKEALRLQTERADFQQRRADKWVAIAERYGAILADLKDAEAPSAESAHS